MKGARRFGFERVVAALQQPQHGTVLEVNLDALTHNLHHYRRQLRPGTRLMVMVKAFAYGSGSYEVASLLEFQRADYLAVAYADEGQAAARERHQPAHAWCSTPAPTRLTSSGATAWSRKYTPWSVCTTTWPPPRTRPTPAVMRPEPRPCRRCTSSSIPGCARLGFLPRPTCPSCWPC